MKHYRDSNPYTEKFYIQNLRKMSIEQRLRISFELNAMAMEICKAGIIAQNPDITEEGINKELQRRLMHDSWAKELTIEHHWKAMKEVAEKFKDA